MQNRNLGILGRWLMDEGEPAKIVIDSSGNGNDGTLGSLQLNDPLSSKAPLPQWIKNGPRDPNKPGKPPRPALRFFGKQFIEVRASTTLEPCVVTVEARVRSTDPSKDKARREGGVYVLSKGAHKCNFPSYALQTHRVTEKRGGLFFLYTTGSFHLSPGAEQSIWNEKWHHIAGVFDGRRASLYVDGKSVGPSPPIDDTFINYKMPTHSRFYIGMYRGQEVVNGREVDCDFGFIGDICDVRVWRGALSTEEIMLRSKGAELP